MTSADTGPTVTSQGDITQLLGAFRQGDRDALDRVLPMLYGPLRAMARRQLRRPLPGRTLNPTALVHEAYLKLVDQSRADWRDRQHFLAVSATAMRHIVVDYARRKAAQKRGGDALHTLIDGERIGAAARQLDVLALDEALQKLSELDERLTRTVELRFFGGLTVEETAQVLEISPRTVKNDWRKARALLYRFLGEGVG